MRNTAPNLKKNPDGLTTLRMPVIPTIKLLFVIWTNAPFLLQLIEAWNAIIINFRGEENFAGENFRGRKISRNSIRSEFYFRGRKFSRKIKIREYSEHFLHAKKWRYTVSVPRSSSKMIRIPICIWTQKLGDRTK